MISPAVNMGTNPSPYLSFRLATAEVTTNHINTLKVFFSVNCGLSWNEIYSKTGQALVTSNSSASNYVPASKNDWRQELINVSQLASASYVTFKFEYTRDTIPAANSIYIDDINISSPTSIVENSLSPLKNISIYPIPSEGDFTVDFYLASSQKVKFSIYDISGRLVNATVYGVFEAGEQKQNLKMQDVLPDGIYFLKIETATSQVTHKIIIGD